MKPLYLQLPDVCARRLRQQQQLRSGGVRPQPSRSLPAGGPGAPHGFLPCWAGRLDELREARPPEQRGASGDDEQALQVPGVVGREGVAQASAGAVVRDGDAGTAPGVGVGAGVLPHSRRTTD